MHEIKEEFDAWYDSAMAYNLPMWEELPDIDLYMDQVVGLMVKYLSIQDIDEKLITPSMINNYVKMNIIPAPVKKRYNRTHIAYLIIVCILKQTLSIADIKNLIEHRLQEQGIAEVYHDFCILYKAAYQGLFTVLHHADDAREAQKFSASMENLALEMAIVSSVSKTVAGKMIELQNRNREKAST